MLLIRTNGGREIGMGHIFRCMTIANWMRSRVNISVLFIVNDDEAVKSVLQDNDFEFEILAGGCLHEPELKRVLIRIHSSEKLVALVDLKPDISSEIQVLQRCNIPVVLMDNVTSPRFIADMNIYPVAHFDPSSLDWHGYCGKVFGGADYVPVAQSYIRARQKATLLKLEPPYQVLVTMGGSDPNNLTHKVVSSLLELSELINIKVIIGPAFSTDARLNKIEKQKFPNVEFIRNKEDLSSIMCESHIAITALGTTLYELAAVGVPAIIISNYEEDDQDMESYKKLGVHLPLGYYASVQPEIIKTTVKDLLSNQQHWEMMRNKGWEMIDGKGAERIARLLSYFTSEGCKQ